MPRLMHCDQRRAHVNAAGVSPRSHMRSLNGLLRGSSSTPEFHWRPHHRLGAFCWAPSSQAFGLDVSLDRFGLVGPMSAEQMSLVFFGHGGECHHAHDQEDQEENHGNYENRHTSPLRPFWDGSERHAVTAITGSCEPERVDCASLPQSGYLLIQVCQGSPH